MSQEHENENWPWPTRLKPAQIVYIGFVLIYLVAAAVKFLGPPIAGFALEALDGLLSWRALGIIFFVWMVVCVLQFMASVQDAAQRSANALEDIKSLLERRHD